MFSKIAYIISTAVFTVIDHFQNSPKVNNLFGLIQRANLQPRTLKNRPIWSHCSSTSSCGRHSSVAVLPSSRQTRVRIPSTAFCSEMSNSAKLGFFYQRTYDQCGIDHRFFGRRWFHSFFSFKDLAIFYNENLLIIVKFTPQKVAKVVKFCQIWSHFSYAHDSLFHYSEGYSSLK